MLPRLRRRCPAANRLRGWSVRTSATWSGCRTSPLWVLPRVCEPSRVRVVDLADGPPLGEAACTAERGVPRRLGRVGRRPAGGVAVPSVITNGVEVVDGGAAVEDGAVLVLLLVLPPGRRGRARGGPADSRPAGEGVVPGGAAGAGARRRVRRAAGPAGGRGQRLSPETRPARAGPALPVAVPPAPPVPSRRRRCRRRHRRCCSLRRRRPIRRCRCWPRLRTSPPLPDRQSCPRAGVPPLPVAWRLTTPPRRRTALVVAGGLGVGVALVTLLRASPRTSADETWGSRRRRWSGCPPHWRHRS